MKKSKFLPLLVILQYLTKQAACFQAFGQNSIGELTPGVGADPQNWSCDQKSLVGPKSYRT